MQLGLPASVALHAWPVPLGNLPEQSAGVAQPAWQVPVVAPPTMLQAELSPRAARVSLGHPPIEVELTVHGVV